MYVRLLGTSILIFVCAWLNAPALGAQPLHAVGSDVPSAPSLAVGSVAPDIVGHDLDGVEFRLSDYRGKVVVLEFSGDWCGICRSEYPYERLMLDLYKNNWPFAILSVNSDSDPALAKQAKAAQGLTYRSWWDGRSTESSAGPIAAAWHVTGWPTLYVLDGDGVIRFVNLRQEDLLKAVRQLVTDQVRRAAKNSSGAPIR